MLGAPERHADDPFAVERHVLAQEEADVARRLADERGEVLRRVVAARVEEEQRHVLLGGQPGHVLAGVRAREGDRTGLGQRGSAIADEPGRGGEVVARAD